MVTWSKRGDSTHVLSSDASIFLPYQRRHPKIVWDQRKNYFALDPKSSRSLKSLAMLRESSFFPDPLFW